MSFIRKGVLERAFNTESPCFYAWEEIFQKLEVAPYWLMAPTAHEVLGKGVRRHLLGWPRQWDEKPIGREEAMKAKLAMEKIYKEISPWFISTAKGYEYIVKEHFDYSSHGVVCEVEHTTCSHCGARELGYLLSGYLFEGRLWDHISGPYYRCTECSKVQRPTTGTLTTVEQGDHSASYDFAIHQLQCYVERLGEMGWDAIRIEGRNLNWRGSSGHREILADAEVLFEMLSIGNDFNMEFWGFLDSTARATCSHHDANSSFELIPGVFDEQGRFISHEDYEEAKRLNEVMVALGDYDCGHVAPETYQETLKYNIETWLGNGPAADIAIELGLAITPSIAENLVNLHLEYDN